MQWIGTNTGKAKPIQEIYTNTKKGYRNRRLVQISESNTVLENSSRKDFKLFTAIKKRIICQAGKC